MSGFLKNNWLGALIGKPNPRKGCAMKELYKILDEDHNDYHLGFEVQSPQKAFISWDATYAEVLQSPFVKPGSSFLYRHSAGYHEFKYPVRIGNLLLKYFGFFDRPSRRSDIAVQTYHFLVDRPYSIELNELMEIKSALARHLEDVTHGSYYEIGIDFQVKDNILLHFYYWQDVKRLRLEVFNLREYSQLLLNEEYESRMQISDHLVFNDKNFHSEIFNYKEDATVKRRPPVLTERFGKNPVLWLDKANGILGMANEKYANFIGLDQIQSIELERALPAKGGGGDMFRILKKDEKYPTEFFSLSCRAFHKDNLTENIERIFGKKLIFRGEYNDC